MNETYCKALMAAIILSSLVPPEDEDVCIFDAAASLADDLYAHVVGSVGEDHTPLVFPSKPPDGKAN